MNIHINRVKEFPVFSPVATQSEIEIAAALIDMQLEVARTAANEVRALVDKLNESLPCKKVSTFALDDVPDCFVHVIDQVLARPNMIRELREGDR